MYDMTQNRLPAPYELNQFGSTPMGQPNNFSNANNPMASAMKRGGRAKTRGMTTVHMNPHEISIMEHLQGHSRYNKDGVKEFHHLEELLKNPHIARSAHHHARHHHAQGGLSHAHLEHLRQGGRFGDSTLAAIGPHTQNFFNQMAGHPTHNPYTGHPEYWSIGGALKGLWNTVKTGAAAAAPHVAGIARAALPAVLPMAQQALGSKFGGLGEMAGQALGSVATNALGPQEGPANPYHEAMGQALGRTAEGLRSGASASQAFGQGMQTAGSRLGGGFGSALEGAGESLGRGGGLRESLGRGAQSGFNAMGGREGLQNMASNVAQGFGNGGFSGARDAARGQFSDYRRRAMPQMPHPQQDYGQDYEQGYGSQYPDEMEQYA